MPTCYTALVPLAWQHGNYLHSPTAMHRYAIVCAHCDVGTLEQCHLACMIKVAHAHLQHALAIWIIGVVHGCLFEGVNQQKHT